MPRTGSQGLHPHTSTGGPGPGSLWRLSTQRGTHTALLTEPPTLLHALPPDFPVSDLGCLHGQDPGHLPRWESDVDRTLLWVLVGWQDFHGWDGCGCLGDPGQAPMPACALGYPVETPGRAVAGLAVWTVVSRKPRNYTVGALMLLKAPVALTEAKCPTVLGNSWGRKGFSGWLRSPRAWAIRMRHL